MTGPHGAQARPRADQGGAGQRAGCVAWKHRPRPLHGDADGAGWLRKDGVRSIQEARAPAAPTGKVSARALVAPAAGAVVEAAGVVKPRPVRVHRCDKCNHRARGDGEFEHKGHIGWIGPRSGPVATFCVVPLERKLQSKWLSLPKMTRSRYRGKHAQLSDEECMEKYDRECVEKDITL